MLQPAPASCAARQAGRASQPAGHRPAFVQEQGIRDSRGHEVGHGRAPGADHTPARHLQRLVGRQAGGRLGVRRAGRRQAWGWTAAGMGSCGRQQAAGSRVTRQTGSRATRQTGSRVTRQTGSRATRQTGSRVTSQNRQQGNQPKCTRV